MQKKIAERFHLVNGEADINPRDLYDFFKQSAIYQIPLYQRPYSWGKKEVNQLLNDIEKSIDNDDIWFLGPIFTASEEHDASYGKKIIYLLDGQQRITTIVLITRVIATLEYFYSDGFDYLLLGSLPEFQNNGNPDEEKIDNFKNELNENISYLIKDILIFDEPSKDKIPKFQTGESCRKELDKWILNVTKIKDNDTYKKYRDIDTSNNNNFELTKKTLNQNIDLIYNYFEKKIDSNIAEGLIFLNKFISHLLRKLYFIHIPLREKDDVLDIFESINNRGKKLKLSDMLRFTSIKAFTTDTKKQDDVGRQWSNLYMMVEKYRHFFKDTDEFVERYINSVGDQHNGYTNDYDRLERFKKLYSTNYLDGMHNINHCIQMIDYVFDETKFKTDLDKKGHKKDSEKLSYLLILLKEVLSFSTNSQVLLMGYFNKMHDSNMHKSMLVSSKLDASKTLLIFLWQFIKYVIAAELYSNLKSNVVRSKFFNLAQNIKSATIYEKTADSGAKVSDKYLLEKQKINGGNIEFIKNLAKQKFSSTQKQETTVLLYYFQILDNMSQINTSNLIDKKHCDHIIPNKWYKKTCWIKKIIETDYKIINPINGEREFHKKINTSDKYPKIIMSYIEELWDEKNSDDSFIQLIGNKIYIDGKMNMDKSDKCWKGTNGARETMKEYMIKKGNSSFIIPLYNPPYNEDDFGLAQITNRTSHIIKIICENSDKKWATLK